MEQSQFIALTMNAFQIFRAIVPIDTGNMRSSAGHNQAGERGMVWRECRAVCFRRRLRGSRRTPAGFSSPTGKQKGQLLLSFCW